MRTESIAVLKWVPSTVLAQGEDAVIALLETSLREAAAGAGIPPQGTLRVRPVGVNEYPHAMASQPTDDPGALLHMAELLLPED